MSAARPEIVFRRLQLIGKRRGSAVVLVSAAHHNSRRRRKAGSMLNAGSSGASGASGGAPYSRRLAQLKDEVARAAKTGHTLAWAPPPEEAPPRLGAPEFPTPHQSPEEFAGCHRPTVSMPAAAEWAELDRQARPRHSWAISPLMLAGLNNLPSVACRPTCTFSATWR